LEQLEFLYSIDPALCYDYLFADNKFDPGTYFSKEMIRKDSSMMAEVIRSGADHRKRPPTKIEVQRQLDDVFAGLTKTHGSDINVLANPTDQKNDKNKVCKKTYYLYQAITRLPERKSGPWLRFIFVNA
jgi:hypothetical protein